MSPTYVERKVAAFDRRQMSTMMLRRECATDFVMNGSGRGTNGTEKAGGGSSRNFIEAAERLVKPGSSGYVVTVAAGASVFTVLLKAAVPLV